VVEQAAPNLKGETQAVWLRRLEGEKENLWAALQWLIEQHEVIPALRFCDAFGKFCGLNGYWSKERYWLKGGSGIALCTRAKCDKSQSAASSRASCLSP